MGCIDKNPAYLFICGQLLNREELVRHVKSILCFKPQLINISVHVMFENIGPVGGICDSQQFFSQNHCR